MTTHRVTLIGIVTRSGSDRIIRHAHEYARKHNRKKVTTVHKANVPKYTGGLFLEVARELAQEYPNIASNDRIEKAVAAVIREGTHVTGDLNPTRFVGTREMTQAIIDRLL